MKPLAHPIVFVQDAIPADVDDPVRELGGKGTSLRRLAEEGLRVPRGFTLCAEICRRFLADDGQWPEGVWDAVVAGIHRLETETGRPFAAVGDGADPSERPLLLAVRSGAAESMPGLLKTHLGVGARHESSGESPPAAGDPWELLRSAIAGVFRSWDQESARDYRQTNGIAHSLGTAVNVQEMIACEFSGVLFTQSPDPEGAGEEAGAEADVIAIEAVAGLGDDLVAGRSDPDRWTVRRDDLQVVSSPTGSGQPPSRLVKDLSELCRIALRLEQDFDIPLDIEWGIDSDGLVFFQARPIARPAIPIPLGDIPQRECERLRGLAAGGARMWVRHNLDETLPHPTPLTWSLWRRFMSGSGGLGTLYRRLGYRPSREIDDAGFLVLIGGRIFADPDRATSMFGEGYPFRYEPAVLRTDPSTLDRAPTQFDPNHADPLFLWRLPVFLWRTLRMRRRLAGLFLTAADRFEQQVLPPFLEMVAKERQRNLTDLDPRELLTLFEARRRLVLDEFGPESLLPGMLGGLAFSEFEQQVIRVLGTDEGRSLARDLVPSGDLELIDRQQYLLTASRSATGIGPFLHEFGHRAIGEMELAVPRWRETPELVAKLAIGSREVLMAGDAAVSVPEAHAASVERLREALTRAGGSSLVSNAKIRLDRCWRFLPYRDRGKHVFLMGYELLREVAQELAERFDLGSRFYDLTTDQWPDLLNGKDFTHVIAERRREAEAFRRMTLSDVIEADNVEVILGSDSTTTAAATTEVLTGTPLVGGQGAGDVWNAAAAPLIDADFSRGVLVCQALEPSYGPLLGRLSAVVVEQGGALSHGAILARQWGLPVVRLPAATRRLISGQRLHVDGDSGCVRVVRGDSS